MSCPGHAKAKATGIIHPRDVDLIRDAVRQLESGGIVVDLGAGWGATALAAFSERRDISVYSVDHDPTRIAAVKESLEDAGPGKFWVGVPKRSIEAAGFFGDETVALILLDTSHEYEDTVNEIKAWLPKLLLEGLFWFHDYDAGHGDVPRPLPQYLYPGLQQAVDEAIARGELVELNRKGWSILTQKKGGNSMFVLNLKTKTIHSKEKAKAICQLERLDPQLKREVPGLNWYDVDNDPWRFCKSCFKKEPRRD